MELKILRMKARMNQAEAAEKIGVTQAALCDWENGKYRPKAASIAKLAEAYGVSVSEIRAAVEDAVREREARVTVDELLTECGRPMTAPTEDAGG